MSQSIVFLAGSPSTTSRSTLVARAVSAEAHAAGLRSVFWSLSDFDPADVLFGRGASPGVVRFVDEVKGAVGLVLATPVYKATYTGSLKAIVDFIPPDALVDKPALGIATARQAAHAVTVDQAYRSLFGFFKARALETLFFIDDELKASPEGELPAVATQKLRGAAKALAAAVNATARAGSGP